ncbi:hypothetical protein F8B43_5173 [Methylorubrum populi]|uniref:Uncharacterized protein n=1 Tax=Methylorubrum populi TaxID=223967 RepID=A0A833J0N9_9HYPH|nr:hypothetical protein F8B43_5173 [Methylorubrum populi]
MAFLANLAPFAGILVVGALFAVGHHRWGRA